jgi:hypothetical protein
VVILGCTYLTVGWVRGILSTGLGPVIPRAGRIGAGLANCAALEKCGMAPKLLPPLPGGLAHAVCVKVLNTMATKAIQIDVFIYLTNPRNLRLP